MIFFRYFRSGETEVKIPSILGQGVYFKTSNSTNIFLKMKWQSVSESINSGINLPEPCILRDRKNLYPSSFHTSQSNAISHRQVQRPCWLIIATH